MVIGSDEQAMSLTDIYQNYFKQVQSKCLFQAKLGKAYIFLSFDWLISAHSLLSYVSDITICRKKCFWSPSLVFCYQNCSDLLSEKKCSSDIMLVVHISYLFNTALKI